MANIKELAEKAGVSPSTASIVVNGKSKERKISQKTQDKVWKAAKDIGYRPNISARRLRDQHTMDNMIIALYWSSDFRTNLMTRFLQGLQNSVLTQQKNIEFVIHPYQNDQLKRAAGIAEISKYHAAIICNASNQDLAYLEETKFPVPVILYHRESEYYPYVSVDDEYIGRLAAEVFLSHHRRKALLTGDTTLFPGMQKRIQGFIEAGNAGKLDTMIYPCGMQMKDGYAFLKEHDGYDCIFALSDHQAIGMLRYLMEQQKQLPDDIELLAVGSADHELEEYAAIPLSVIELPMEEMAASCLQLAIQQIEMKESEQSVLLPVNYIPRKTTKR